ncbi:hypothetical protein PPN31114_02304 [Pandoraea pneumonica]|jgi:hypothetical protein|uniref:Uncharacterized protein n=1 Tax=Pandoraea pneumonica TaxID=2508299 RepID=A0A5E4V156_9BURK|nr:hypothetical protein [Pandoraea pneumonica]VVE04500.1 hypothetical protein PPN31114_02304 [Pandoraea pneumonica]
MTTPIQSPPRNPTVAQLISLPPDMRIGLTKKGGFVSYGGTSFYLHPKQTMRVSRLMQSYRKADSSGRVERTRPWQQLFAHVRAVLLGVKARHFVKRFMGDMTDPRPPVVVPTRPHTANLRNALNVVNAANRLNAGARHAMFTRTVPLNVPTAKAKLPSALVPESRASAPPDVTLRSHSQQARSALTLLSGNPGWSSAPQLTPPASSQINS